MKKFLALTFLLASCSEYQTSSEEMADDNIYLVCKENEIFPSARNYIVVLDMDNKTADVTITEPDYSEKIDIVLQPKYISIEIKPIYVTLSFDIDRKTLEMVDLRNWPPTVRGQCTRVGAEGNIL